MTGLRFAPILALAALVAACGTGHLDLGGGVARSAPVFAMGANGTCILGSDATARCFGIATLGRFGVDPSTLAYTCNGAPCASVEPVHVGELATTSIAVGESFVCAIIGDVTQCFGGNASGTLGRGVHDRSAHVTGLPIDGSFGFVELVAGRGHTCGRTTTGDVACWGVGAHGELGLDPMTLADCGMPVDASEAARFAVAPTDTLRCNATATLVPGLGGISALRAGPFATCAFSPTSGWRCFGRNVDGSLGVASAAPSVSSPTALATPDVVDVALGPTHGCVVDGLGRVYCFGHGELGQLGLGTSAPDVCTSGPCALVPTRVVDAPRSQRVAVGDAHSCALTNSGSIVCFGSDAAGQLGDSDTTSEDCGSIPCARVPHQVAYIPSFTGVSANGDGTCATTRDGDLACWGDGTNGALGAYPPRIETFPYPIYGIP